MSVVVPSRVRFGVLLFLASLSLITYLDRVCISRASRDIGTDLSISEEDMGLVFGAFAVGYALFEVPGGWLGDRWGSRRVLMRIVIWWSVFTGVTGCVWAFSFEWLGYSVTGLTLILAIRFLFGAGEAGAYPNLARVVKVWFPYRERGLAQGSIWMSARLGGAIAPLVIGRLSALLSWRQAFFILGGLGVVWAIAFWAWFRDRPEDKPEWNDAERELIRPGSTASPLDALALGVAERKWQGAPKSEDVVTAAAVAGVQREQVPDQATQVREGEAPAEPVASLARQEPRPPELGTPAEDDHARPPMKPMLASATMWAMCVASFGVSFGWYFFPTWQPEYLSGVFHIKYEDSELLTGLPFLCGAIGSIIGGGWSDRLVRVCGRRWGRSLVGLVGFTGAGLCVLATGFAVHAWQAVTLLCLAFLINDLAIPAIWAVCADVGGRFVGTVSGIMNMAGGLGAVLGPVLIPRVRSALVAIPDAMRWRIIFMGLASAWFLAAAAWLFIDASRPLFEKPTV